MRTAALPVAGCDSSAHSTVRWRYRENLDVTVREVIPKVNRELVEDAHRDSSAGWIALGLFDVVSGEVLNAPELGEQPPALRRLQVLQEVEDFE